MEEVGRILGAACGCCDVKLDPHPCLRRCWRVGAPADIDERGRCMECGSDGVVRARPGQYMASVRPEDVVRLAEGWLALRRSLDEAGVLSPEDSEEFLRMLAEPARAIPELARLLREKRASAVGSPDDEESGKIGDR